ncbi:hypothetical protein GCM10010840_35950 [Deinococcus aerolatus]|uniref:Uncharacterized protein n=1 Tax=Deinococcus aerolatus TaxID=522487 RepID=A0ABQ2GG23_9DEIO|nr:hypothetical protein GCM10010840_35950 [Deinococcus aerolatus]
MRHSAGSDRPGRGPPPKRRISSAWGTRGYVWQWMPAGRLFILTVLATNFLGDGLRDALEPKGEQ